MMSDACFERANGVLSWRTWADGIAATVRGALRPRLQQVESAAKKQQCSGTDGTVMALRERVD